MMFSFRVTYLRKNTLYYNVINRHYPLTSINKNAEVNGLTIKDIPHPKSLPFFGTKLNFFISGSSTKLHEYIENRHKQLGPIFYESLGGGPKLVFISDPNLMKTLFLKLEGKHPLHILPDAWLLYEKLYGSKRGLLFMNGEEWLNNRRIMNKFLLQTNTENWLKKPIQETIQLFVLNWKNKTEQGRFSPDLEHEFYKLSTNGASLSDIHYATETIEYYTGRYLVVIQILLGDSAVILGSTHYDELLSIFSESVKKIFQNTTKLYAMPLNLCYRLDLKVWRDFKESVDHSLSLAQKIVQEILLLKQKSNGLIRKLCDENLSDENITKIAADFVIAAGDTTAYTSMWIVYLLSQNSAIQTELRKKDENYYNCVVKEAMRLYPVAPFLTRILPNDCLLQKYQLNAGTPIIASIFTSGRDESNFSKADQFLPYRWDRNDVRRQELTNHVPSASLPFAFGARSCVGKKIAMLQLTELVRQLVENFELVCTNKEEVKPVMSQVLVPNRKINVSITARNK